MIRNFLKKYIVQKILHRHFLCMYFYSTIRVFFFKSLWHWRNFKMFFNNFLNFFLKTASFLENHFFIQKKLSRSLCCLLWRLLHIQGKGFLINLIRIRSPAFIFQDTKPAGGLLCLCCFCKDFYSIISLNILVRSFHETITKIRMALLPLWYLVIFHEEFCPGFLW